VALPTTVVADYLNLSVDDSDSSITKLDACIIAVIKGKKKLTPAPKKEI
jgi:hypothetical protein